MSERITDLRRRMIEDMRVRNLSPTTQASCVHAVKKFSRHFGRSPADLGLDEVHVYQVHLVRGGIAWATLNQTVSALRFFYGVTLGRKDLPERIPYARKPKTLPVVLSAADVARLIEAVDDTVCRTALITVYRRRSLQSRSRTRRSSMRCCSKRPRRRSRSSPPIASTSAPRSAPPWCCTPGGRR
jgi:integrase